MPTENSELRFDKTTSNSFSIHWTAIVAGLFITMVAYSMLMTLGVAIGATQLRDAFSMTDPEISSGTIKIGTWVFISILLSLFAGSYASGRASGFVATRIGYIQGAVISAAFFLLLVVQVGTAVGLVGAGLGGLKDVAAESTKGLAANPHVADLVEDSFNGLHLKSDPKMVAAGLISRFLYADDKSAINYLADQTGISREEAQGKFQTLKAQVTSVADRLTKTTADTARTLAWFSFWSMFIGTVAAMIGGALGAQFSMRKPVDNLDRRALRALEHGPAVGQ